MSLMQSMNVEIRTTQRFRMQTHPMLQQTPLFLARIKNTYSSVLQCQMVRYPRLVSGTLVVDSGLYGKKLALTTCNGDLPGDGDFSIGADSVFAVFPLMSISWFR